MFSTPASAASEPNISTMVGGLYGETGEEVPAPMELVRLAIPLSALAAHAFGER